MSSTARTRSPDAADGPGRTVTANPLADTYAASRRRPWLLPLVIATLGQLRQPEPSADDTPGGRARRARSRFIRWLSTCAGALAEAGGRMTGRPGTPMPARWPDPIISRARQATGIGHRWGDDTLAPFALRSDKEWFMTGQTLIAYWVGAPGDDPVPAEPGPAKARR